MGIMRPCGRRYPSALSLFCLALSLCLSVSLPLRSTFVTAADDDAPGRCHTFQSLEKPRKSPWLYRCSADKYKASSCCTEPTAKRAYNWVWEDDGCGVVGHTCARALTDLACAQNCASDLVVTGFNYNNTRPVPAGKMVISMDDADRLFEACKPYAWCGTTQEMTTDCKFLAVKVKTDSRGRTIGATTSVKSARDTCTLVADLTPISFAENIIGVVVHGSDVAGLSTELVTVLDVGGPGGASAEARPLGLVLTLIAIAATIWTQKAINGA